MRMVVTADATKKTSNSNGYAEYKGIEQFYIPAKYHTVQFLSILF